MIVWPDCRFATADCNWLTLETLMTVPVGAARGGTLTLLGKDAVLLPGVTVALGSVAGFRVRLLAGVTVNVYAWLPVRPVVLLSVAVIVNDELPEVLGVPLSTPVLAFTVNHAGRLPAVTAKL